MSVASRTEPNGIAPLLLADHRGVDRAVVQVPGRKRLGAACSRRPWSHATAQRAMLESFFNVLYERGVRITLLGLGLEQSDPEGEQSPAEPALSMAAITEWLTPGLVS